MRLLSRAWIILLSAFVALRLANPAHAEIFMQVPGETGFAADTRYPGWCRVSNLSSSVSRATSTSEPTFRELVLTKEIDGASPGLNAACTNGRVFATIPIEATQNGVGKLRVMSITLRTARITDISVYYTASTTTETVTISFEGIDWSCTEITNARAAMDYRVTWDNGLLQGSTSNGLPLDTDGDGMTDEFEKLFGLNPARSDANDDADGDGLTNLTEYFAGTNPKSATSAFRVSAARLGTSAIELKWPSVAGKRYLVYSTTNLASNSWTLVATVPSSGDGVTSFNVASSGTMQFFRVETP